MGGSGSTRWRDHRKRPLVEEALAIDLVALRRAGAFKAEGGSGTLTWTREQRRMGTCSWRLARESEGGGHLEVLAQVEGTREPIAARIALVAAAVGCGGVRWLLQCPAPTCEARVLRLYVSHNAERIGCRGCLGLAHRSAQQHDARVDLARRDPRGFVESRASLRGPASAMATIRIAEQALQRMAAPRRGRGWGRTSVTAWQRVLDRILPAERIRQ